MNHQIVVYYHILKILQETNPTHRLFAAKKETISNAVVEWGNDSKALYRLIDNISGIKKDNPLSPSATDKNLAEEFADFFLGKIEKIRDGLKHKALYTPSRHPSQITMKAQ